MLTIVLSTFISALDLGIVATAIPAITQDFRSLNQIAWYSGACFILVGTSSAMWGKLFTYLPARWVYFSCLVLYLIGSILAAASPDSIALIIGRAIQGWGCAGTLGGSVTLINFTARPSDRPLLIGIWMGVFMTSTVLGPVLGGVFTTEVTWRWCFWINLPIGGLALGLQLLFLRVPKQIKPIVATWKEVLLQLDLLGFVILTASLICYTLALQWGGLSKPWSDGSVIATLVMWLVLLVAFGANEWLMGLRAMTPLYLLKSRMTWSSCVYGFMFVFPSVLLVATHC
jgi:MFS family permease